MKEQDDILEVNPSRYIAAGIFVILLFFGGLALWSVLFPFQGAVIATGTVAVSGERKLVQHFEGGIIDKILVKDGDKVVEGDVLIELKSTNINANVDLLMGRLWAKLALKARLTAEATRNAEIQWSDELLVQQDNPAIMKILSAEKDLFVSKRTDIQGKKDLYNSQIMQLGNRIDGSKQELNSVNDVIKYLEEDLQSKIPLVKEKYMGKSNVLELQRNLAEYNGRKGKLVQDIAQFNQMIQELKLRIIDLDTQYKDQALEKLKETSDEIDQIREQIKPQLDAQERLKLRAPVSGVVINMQVHSEISGVVQPAKPVLEIVPEGSKLIVKAQVRPQDITSVKSGQEAKVQLAAFYRQTTPPVKGRVLYVSPDLLSEATPHGTISFYETHIEVDEQDLKSKNAYLSPGMPVSCYITTDKRTVISYLLSPLLENVDKAMRE